MWPKKKIKAWLKKNYGWLFIALAYESGALLVLFKMLTIVQYMNRASSVECVLKNGFMALICIVMAVYFWAEGMRAVYKMEEDA